MPGAQRTEKAAVDGEERRVSPMREMIKEVYPLLSRNAEDCTSLSGKLVFPTLGLLIFIRCVACLEPSISVSVRARKEEASAVAFISGLAQDDRSVDLRESRSNQGRTCGRTPWLLGRRKKLQQRFCLSHCSPSLMKDPMRQSRRFPRGINNTPREIIY